MPYTERNNVTVRVPATTTNLGPGVDVLGMALDIWVEVCVSRADTFSVTCEGKGLEHMPRDETNYVVIGLKKIFDKFQKPCPPCSYHIKSEIPYGSGLGSSSACIVAGLIAGLVLSGTQLPVRNHEMLLQMAAEVEGHVDSVSAAIYGGLQLGLHSSGRWRSHRLRFPHGIHCIVLITGTFVNKTELRQEISKTVPFEDAVGNIARTALLVEAFSRDNLQLLRFCMDDRLHQFQRSRKLPHLLPAIKAATDAGAIACWLSGQGPSVCAMTSTRCGDPLTRRASEGCDEGIAEAMYNVARRLDMYDARAFVTTPSERGAHIVSADPPFSSGFMRHFGYQAKLSKL
ncbi:hypothetical protein XU18_0228 [Perkinsela sp. CCAP 1560/4]|nr:hypothetical protein XU18_0228 [Perkinsela sp. CCAP 1560/4]|eukprot:KNH09543.1 hypothetical protein XU18_0228 [Perkinsela sp. CCAP 1560/4]